MLRTASALVLRGALAIVAAVGLSIGGRTPTCAVAQTSVVPVPSSNATNGNGSGDRDESHDERDDRHHELADDSGHKGDGRDADKSGDRLADHAGDEHRRIEAVHRKVLAYEATVKKAALQKIAEMHQRRTALRRESDPGTGTAAAIAAVASGRAHSLAAALKQQPSPPIQKVGPVALTYSHGAPVARLAAVGGSVVDERQGGGVLSGVAVHRFNQHIAIVTGESR